MFTGTTPPEVKLLLQDLMKGVKGKDVFIGCSGNYTTDKIMSAMGYTVHSNDVSLYSKLISDLLLDTNTDIEVVNPELRMVFDTWDDTKYKKLIQVMFAMRVSNFHQRKNDCQEEMFNAFIEQSKVYYHNTISRIEKGALDFNIKSFFYGVFSGFLKSKGVGISFPPTYKGGSYEEFIKAATEVKKKFNIKSNTVAFARMVDICKAYLQEIKDKEV